MLDLKSFRQAGRDIKKIDMGTANEWSKKSVKEKTEYAGNFDVYKQNDTLTLYLTKMYDGHVDSVDVPSGWTWHTHPRGCASLDNCSIIPPSATDMKLFAQKSDEQHMVMSKTRIYWVRAINDYSATDCNDILIFYEKLEKNFVNKTYDHDRFDEIFTLSSKLGHFFFIFKFRNKKIVEM